MPRFTIGSILTGAALAALAVFGFETFGRGRLVAAPAHPPAPAAAVPVAVDPVSGQVQTGHAIANDYSLEDAYSWGGDPLASTW